MKHLLATAAILLSTPLAADTFDKDTPITVAAIEARLDAIENLAGTLSLTHLEEMVAYDEANITHRVIEVPDLEFDTGGIVTYPEAVQYEYIELSYDESEFNEARTDFIKDINKFFVNNDDNIIDFNAYGTNMGVLGVVANSITTEWNNMNVYAMNLDSDPTNLSHWMNFEAAVAKVQTLNDRYIYLYGKYESLLNDVTAWTSDDVDAYLSAVNQAALDEALDGPSKPALGS